MENKSFNGLEIKPISQVVEETKDFIERRKSGQEQSLRVSSPKVNSLFMDGFDWNRIITLAGMPGSGKTTLARQ